MSKSMNPVAALAVLFLFIAVPVAIFGVTFVMAAAWAFVLRDMWAWFIVPLGAVPISAWHAYGLVLTASVFTHSLARTKNEDEDASAFVKIATPIALSLIGAGLVWLIGYFVAQQI